MDMESYLQQVGKSEEELKEEMRPGTQERLVRSLALKKLAEDQNIEVTSEEVDKEIEDMLSSSNTTDESVRQAVLSESFRNQIESTLLTRRTLERLAQIVQGDGAVSEEPTEEEVTEEPDQGGSKSDA
jgi:FKBP-type peptidyl-prolyl cis-trans isomerase (trigger factor)